VSILRALIWVATAVCVFMLFRPLVEQLLQLSTDAGFP